MTNAIITKTGSYIPPDRVPNSHFLDNVFYDANGQPLDRQNSQVIQKLHEITGIEERRYAPQGVCASDMAFMAAEAALDGVDRESLDYIIVAHNFGDVKEGIFLGIICKERDALFRPIKPVHSVTGQYARHALFHFAGSLIGKRDGQYRWAKHPAVFN